MKFKKMFFVFLVIYAISFNNVSTMEIKKTVLERQNTLEQNIKNRLKNDEKNPHLQNLLEQVTKTRQSDTHIFSHIHELLDTIEEDLEKEDTIKKKPQQIQSIKRKSENELLNNESSKKIQLTKESPEKSKSSAEKTGFFYWDFFIKIKNFCISKYREMITEPKEDDQIVHTKLEDKKTLNQKQEKVEIITGPVGLVNFSGVNCYQNAVIQCLFHNASFKNLVDTLAQKSKEQETLIINAECTNRFVTLFKNMEENNLKKLCINPEHFSSFVAQKFFPQEKENSYNYHHEDADEFLTFLLDYLREEQPEMKNNLEKLLTIKELKTTTCSVCETNFFHEQPESILKIQIPHSVKTITLDICLSNFFKPENLQGTDQYNCLVCEKKCDATTYLKLTNLPNLFVIQLKRFGFDSIKKTSSKIETPVTFSLDTLDMTPYLVKNDQEIQNDSDYKLVGVVLHRGNLNYGHYISFVRYPHENAEWIQCDDTTITLKQDNIVQHFAQTGKYVDQFGFVFHPYIFFYQKNV